MMRARIEGTEAEQFVEKKQNTRKKVFWKETIDETLKSVNSYKLVFKEAGLRFCQAFDMFIQLYICFGLLECLSDF